MENIKYKQHVLELVSIFIIILSLFVRNDTYIWVSIAVVLIGVYYTKVSCKIFFTLTIATSALALLSLYTNFIYGLSTFGNYSFLLLLAGVICNIFKK